VRLARTLRVPAVGKVHGHLTQCHGADPASKWQLRIVLPVTRGHRVSKALGREVAVPRGADADTFCSTRHRSKPIPPRAVPARRSELACRGRRSFCMSAPQARQGCVDLWKPSTAGTACGAVTRVCGQQELRGAAALPRASGWILAGAVRLHGGRHHARLQSGRCL